MPIKAVTCGSAGTRTIGKSRRVIAPRLRLDTSHDVLVMRLEDARRMCWSMTGKPDVSSSATMLLRAAPGIEQKAIGLAVDRPIDKNLRRARFVRVRHEDQFEFSHTHDLVGCKFDVCCTSLSERS